MACNSRQKWPLQWTRATSFGVPKLGKPSKPCIGMCLYSKLLGGYMDIYIYMVIHPRNLTNWYQKLPFLKGVNFSTPSFWVSMLVWGSVNTFRNISTPWKFNSEFTTENLPGPKRKGSSSFATIFQGAKLIPPLIGNLIMGPYKPLRTWVDEFIPYYMEISWHFYSTKYHSRGVSPNKIQDFDSTKYPSASKIDFDIKLQGIPKKNKVHR